MRKMKLRHLFLAFGVLIALCLVTYSGLFQPGPAFSAMNMAILLYGGCVVHLLDSAVLAAKVKAEHPAAGAVVPRTAA